MTVTAGGVVKVEPTAEQLGRFGWAIRLWKGPGEAVVGKMHPDGRMLLSTRCAGTWSFLFIGRDGMAVGDWF